MRARDSSPDARAARIAVLERDSFDLLVIGAGVTGSGIARDAALRGLRVALVEKDDFASGTSSRSSRLVHGGVRYLEHGQLGLVFESSAERRRLLQLVPHLVRPLAFTWPVYAGARIGRLKLAAGLALYDALALFRNVGRHRQLGARALIAREPALRPDGLRGGAVYFDAATDDARLTLANALGAVAAGATVVNYVELRSFVANGAVNGAVMRDRIDNRQFTLRARAIVNATGPWSDSVRRLEQEAVGVAAPGSTTTIMRGSVGAHVAVPRERVGNRGALTLVSPVDGRVMFVLPDGAHTVIGTTERPADESPDEVRATEQDVAYLLESANAFFPAAHLGRADIVSAWAGIRPLAASDGVGADLGRASREHAIVHGVGGVITITGGKLTTYRVMARQVVDEVERRLNRRPRSSATESSPLPGGDLTSVDAAIAEARVAVDDVLVAHRLLHAYGSRWRDVWQLAESTPGGTARLSPKLPYLLGEMLYAVEREMACTLGDLLIRRTRLAFETSDHGESVALNVAEAVAPLLGWDATARAREMERFRAETRRIFDIDPA